MKSLAREQRNAADVFLKSWPVKQELSLKRELELEDVMKHDNKIFVSLALQTSDLPRDTKQWFWNQSRAKTNVPEAPCTEAKFYKLNSRKSISNKTENDIPNLKLWVFNIIDEHEGAFTFLWVEKGGETQLNEKLLEELVFLKPLVSPSGSDIWSDKKTQVSKVRYSWH